MVCVFCAVRKVAEGGWCNGIGDVWVRGHVKGRGWAGEGRGKVHVGESITRGCSGPGLTAHLHTLNPFTHTVERGGQDSNHQDDQVRIFTVYDDRIHTLLFTAHPSGPPEGVGMHGEMLHGDKGVLEGGGGEDALRRIQLQHGAEQRDKLETVQLVHHTTIVVAMATASNV